ncbi:uncharacterized protein A4U43_C08F28630 [Asparagus officinalis]|uniref:uncharacterized protein LOC109851390 n=1 Tax=Asparagus officinalis TaxID=4686 RepID=UPI00098E1D07|nr:uncharacterized protein LOC109851390 [Asparagus officinalis]ONK61321.1 uncharacterized protein A4U43_C08F28630 [Asparagus officinalis]
MGLDAYVFDAHKSKLESIPTLRNATHLLISIPPIAGIGDPLLCLHKDLQNLLTSGNLEYLCYLSTTGVYGDCGGTLVSEDYPVNPKTESAKSRVAAEKGWLDLGHELGVPVYVFRLGGIYGPGRSALDTIIKQKSLSEKQTMRKLKRYTARIHVADIYQAIKASFSLPSSGEIYNVVDDDPAPRTEVFAFAQALLRNRCPHMIDQFEEDDTVELQSQQLKADLVDGEKRVSNAKLKEQLGVKLMYPSYKYGLPSILDCYLLGNSAHYPDW